MLTVVSYVFIQRDARAVEFMGHLFIRHLVFPMTLSDVYVYDIYGSKLIGLNALS